MTATVAHVDYRCLLYYVTSMTGGFARLRSRSRCFTCCTSLLNGATEVMTEEIVVPVTKIVLLSRQLAGEENNLRRCFTFAQTEGVSFSNLVAQSSLLRP